MPVAVQIDSEELYDVLRSLNIDEQTARRVTTSLVSTRTLNQFTGLKYLVHDRPDLDEFEQRLVVKLGAIIVIATTLATTILGTLISLK